MPYSVIINITIIINSHANVIAATVHNTRRKLWHPSISCNYEARFLYNEIVWSSILIYQSWRKMYKFKNIKD